MFLSYSRSSKLYFLIESHWSIKFRLQTVTLLVVENFERFLACEQALQLWNRSFMENPRFLQRLEFLKKSWNLPGNFPNLEKICFASEFFFPFGKILFDFTCKFATPSWKKLCSCVFKVSIDHLFDNLESGKNLEFGIQYTNPENLKRRDHR